MSNKSNETSKLSGNKLIKKVGTQRLVALVALIVLYAFFCITGSGFASYNTFIGILDASYYIGFLAIGVTFVLVTGGTDLSCGTVLVCCALISGILYTKAGLPLWLCLVLCVVFGGLFGLCNGFMVAVMDLPAFIATMGTMMVTRGLGSIVSNTASVTYPQRNVADGAFKNLFRYMGDGVSKSGLPTGFVLLIVVSLVMAFILNKTKVGRYIMALGSNKEATRLSGVNVVKWEIMAYMISGLFAGFAAISYAATYSTILPGTGNGFELDAIAGAVIGGTSLSGGVGTIAGTLIGVFIMSVLKTGLPFVGLQPHYQLFFTGIVLIIAVFADTLNRKKQQS